MSQFLDDLKAKLAAIHITNGVSADEAKNLAAEAVTPVEAEVAALTARVAELEAGETAIVDTLAPATPETPAPDTVTGGAV